MSVPKLTQARSYQKKMEPYAEKLFSQLFAKKITRSVNILIIGSGFFPSYVTFKKFFPNARRFTLVEPRKEDTDLFLTYFAAQEDIFQIFTDDLTTFLNTTTDKFDYIYFEHPEVMTLPLILGSLGVKKLRRTHALREAFPYLTDIVTKESIIFASCMSGHELKQFISLMKFTFSLHHEKIIKPTPSRYFYGGPYRCGLSTQIHISALFNRKKAIRAIKKSHTELFLALSTSIIIYIMYSYAHPDANYALQRLLAIILMGGHLYLHRPGWTGSAIRCALLALQIAL